MQSGTRDLHFFKGPGSDLNAVKIDYEVFKQFFTELKRFDREGVDRVHTSAVSCALEKLGRDEEELRGAIKLMPKVEYGYYDLKPLREWINLRKEDHMAPTPKVIGIKKNSKGGADRSRSPSNAPTEQAVEDKDREMYHAYLAYGPGALQ